MEELPLPARRRFYETAYKACQAQPKLVDALVALDEAYLTNEAAGGGAKALAHLQTDYCEQAGVLDLITGRDG